MKRIAAWIAITAIAAAFAALILMTIFGAPANVIIAVLFCLIVIPVIIYAFILIVNIGKPKSDDDKLSGKNKP